MGKIVFKETVICLKSTGQYICNFIVETNLPVRWSSNARLELQHMRHPAKEPLFHVLYPLPYSHYFFHADLEYQKSNVLIKKLLQCNNPFYITDLATHNLKLFLTFSKIKWIITEHGYKMHCSYKNQLLKYYFQIFFLISKIRQGHQQKFEKDSIKQRKLSF